MWSIWKKYKFFEDSRFTLTTAMDTLQTNGGWIGAFQSTNDMSGVSPLKKLNVNWTADLVALLIRSIRTLAVLGPMTEAVIAESCSSNDVHVMPLTMDALRGFKSGGAPAALSVMPDLLIANCKDSRPHDLLQIISFLCTTAIPSVIEFDPKDGAKSAKWFGKLKSHPQVRILDVTGEEFLANGDPNTLEAGCLAIVPRQPSPSALQNAITTLLSRRTGVPLNSDVLSQQHYVRTVEVVSLETAARMAGFRYERCSLGAPNFNIYSRKYDESPRMFEVAWCRDVDLVPHPAWKICVQDRYFVEELGYSNKNTILGMECWPEFGGYWTIRRQQPQIRVSRQGGPYLLVGGDNAYYHWLLNWVPRLMAADLLIQQLPPLRELKIVVPHTQLLQVPEFLTLLYELGVQPQNVVHLHDKAVWRFEELLVPSFFSNGVLSPAVAQWYRRRLQPDNPGTATERIIISRRDAFGGGPPRRRVVNEDAMVAALAPLGFQRYELSRLSIREQIALFQRADMVIGAHGAGFANMIFSPLRAKALVLENSFNHTFMVDMVNVGGGAARSIVCEDIIDSTYEAQHMVGPDADVETRRNRDMKVDTDALLKAVTDWTNE
jgi:capsular polysaccharide biosynthesis protein